MFDMNVQTLWQETKTKWMRRIAVPTLALTLAAFTTYECVKPSPARAANASPSAEPLDVDSVSALLELDKAMETLAARVTPAVVNVTVTSRTKEVAEGDMPQEFKRFFGPGGQGNQFGQFFGQQMPR